MKEPTNQPVSRGERASKPSTCWCGNDTLEVFSTDYLRCSRCETLVLAKMPDLGTSLLVDDERGFYGRQYYESYVTGQLGLPSIIERARTDLEERCIHWLRTLVKYKLPPSRIVELGSSHGGFVVLMCWAGFEATGLELSPWLVELARRTFDVPMLLGPIERQTIEPQSLDAVVLMDVLEHLPDPAGTIRHCLGLLRPDGIVVIQTPEYLAGKTFAEMRAEDDLFLQHLHGPEHLYLFSRKSVRELLDRLGSGHVQFEQAIFSAYDMFLVASQAPLSVLPKEEMRATLSAAASSRLTLALLGVDERLAEFRRWNAESEADRVELRARTRQLEQLLAKVETDGTEEMSKRISAERHADAVASQLNAASEVLRRLEGSYVYRLMRRLGLWGWLARSMGQIAR